MKKRALYIGVMSGTSLDGVDTALVEVDQNKTTLIASHDHPLPSQLKQKVLDVCLGQTTNLIEVGQLDHQLGHLFADAVNALLAKASVRPEDVIAIGNHGQTVFHQPVGNSPFTMQLGDANIVATKTGIDTIADFRRKDMALGGQGAPLVPAFHNAIFQTQDSSIVVLNIGGIANISVLRPDQAVIGFDTGPGNMLMDAWIERHTKRAYDKGAELALQGTVSPELLGSLMTEPYLALKAPKSTGRELFNLSWLDTHLSSFTLSPADVQRTLCEYSAQTIAKEVSCFDKGSSPELLVCGGGAHNPLLMKRLQYLLPTWSVTTTQEKGIDSDNMEAMAFAWLAHQRIHNLPSNLPDVTGASQSASLGVYYYAEK